MTIVFLAIKSKWVDRGLSKIINRMLKRYTDLEIQDFAAVLHLKDDYKISEKKVSEDDWICNNTLKELNLIEEGIMVLGIDREDEEYFGSPSGNFKILPNDVVTVYGKAEGIKSVYKRKKGYKAEFEHEKFMKKEEKRKSTEEEKQKSDTTEK